MSTQKVTPPELRNEGNRVISFSENHGDTINEIAKIVKSLSEGAWDTPAQKKFDQNFTELKKTLDDFTKSLEEYGKAMVAYADDAEELDNKYAQSFS